MSTVFVTASSQELPLNHPKSEAIAFEEGPYGNYARGASRRAWAGVRTHVIRTTNVQTACVLRPGDDRLGNNCRVAFYD